MVCYGPPYFISSLTANKLAEKGNRISFLLPPKTQPMLASLNHHPHLITFIPVPVPRVDGLPDRAEPAHDVPARARPLLMTAMDLTRDTVDSNLARLGPVPRLRRVGARAGPEAPGQVRL